MGLDMYMERTTEELPVYESGMDRDAYWSEAEKVKTVEVAYWRKFNALHAWFVENVQDGVDDCQYALVQKEDLEELVDMLNESIETQEPALIPQGGFFFGSTDVDEYYWEEVRNTADKFNVLLDTFDFENEFLYYGSSW